MNDIEDIKDIDRAKKNEYMREYYQRNKDKIKAINKKYYNNNIEKNRKSRLEYYHKNKDDILAQRKQSVKLKEWRENNKDCIYGNVKEYYKRNKEKILKKHKEYYEKVYKYRSKKMKNIVINNIKYQILDSIDDSGNINDMIAKNLNEPRTDLSFKDVYNYKVLEVVGKNVFIYFGEDKRTYLLKKIGE